ncbi:MAG: hypothetical protein II670_03245 [Alphaproteobacteria bacterium]|nr:hypothetical protein [Alphaproteobacteria bacterium]
MAEEIIVQTANEVKEIDYRKSIIDVIENNQVDGIEEIKSQLDDISSTLEIDNTDIISAQNEDIILMVQEQNQKINNIEAKLDAILSKL